jgi:hypothetical protein
MDSNKSLTIYISTIGQGHLRKCLESCLQLDENDNLYIIIDGEFYKDICQKIINLFNFKCNIHVIINKENLGYWGHGTRNKYHYDLFGDYLLFLDDDKYFVENGVKIIKNNLVKNKINIFQISIGDNIINGDIEYAKIDTSNMVIPLKYKKLFPFWKLCYGGDFYFRYVYNNQFYLLFIISIFNLIFY